MEGGGFNFRIHDKKLRGGFKISGSILHCFEVSVGGGVDRPAEPNGTVVRTWKRTAGALRREGDGETIDGSPVVIASEDRYHDRSVRFLLLLYNIHTVPMLRQGLLLLIAAVLVPSAVAQQAPESDTDAVSTRRPVATYSIVAHDSTTGQMGVAVQSHWFSVGSVVPFAEAGVGAVATQSFVDPRYGPLGLELMRYGRAADEALKALVTTDDGRAVRQVAMVDADGNVATHTGADAVQEAGHHTGEQFSTQANMMKRATVWDAMAEAYKTAEGDLASRLLAALEAAQAEGGDIRGRQSAALVVVRAEPTGRRWEDRIFDLRIEDHETPVAELKRLVRMQRAYRKLNEGDGQVTRGDIQAAMQSYRQAMDIVPDEATNGEAPFWVGVTLASEGRVEEAMPYLRRAQAQNEEWATLITRLPEAGLLPNMELAERLSEAMRTSQK